jgi:rhodanese-related sulfurtransferase
MPRSHRSSSRSRSRTRSRPDFTVWIAAGAVLIVALALFLFLRPSSSLPAEVQPAEAYALLQKGAVFIDVRTPAEWDQGHIPGSTLIPLDVLPDRLNDVPHNRDVVVLCRTGHRSAEGAAILRQAGYSRITCLSGGLQAWVAAGYPVEQ